MKCETIICGVGFKLLISISTSALGFRWACRIQPLLPHENVISCFRHFTFRKKRYGNEKNFIFWCIIFFTFTTDELYTFDDVSSFFPYRKHHLMLMGWDSPIFTSPSPTWNLHGCRMSLGPFFRRGAKGWFLAVQEIAAKWI